MRFQAICIAAFLALSGAVTAQTPMPAQSTCAKAPRSGERGEKSPQLIAARHTMKQACAADMTKYCANVPKGCGGPRKCLKAHASELSASCSSAWRNMRAIKGKGT
jgi:hypothetical protein